MSGNLNSVLIDGNLTRDPEMKTTPRGTKVCNFGLASNRYYEQDNEKVKEVSFFEIESWARLADACAKHLDKGRGVRVSGRLKQDRWADQSGNARTKVKIVADQVIFKPSIKGKDKSEDNNSEDSKSEDSNIEEGASYDLAVAEGDPEAESEAEQRAAQKAGQKAAQKSAQRDKK